MKKLRILNLFCPGLSEFFAYSPMSLKRYESAKWVFHTSKLFVGDITGCYVIVFDYLLYKKLTNPSLIRFNPEKT